VALAARYQSIWHVAAGTTLGMMLANVPAVYLGEAATKIVPMNVVRIGAASLFAIIGIWTLLQTAGILS
jgi:putative Ca2+/H+ antiporter (TMEM165/GDT1 family)